VPHESKSSPREIQNYLGRISTPVKFREMANPQPGETSAQIVKQQLNTLNLTWSL
jgi:hypothetical protein